MRRIGSWVNYNWIHRLMGLDVEGLDISKFLDALNFYVPICVVICYLKIMYSLYHQLSFLVGRFWIKLNCMMSFLQNSRPLHKTHWDKLFLKIGQPYRSITRCARQLSKWSQKKKNLEIFLCLFYENPLFSFGLFIVFLFHANTTWYLFCLLQGFL